MKKFIWNIYLIFLQKIDSTNRYAEKNILIYPNWTVIYAIHQTNGKGVGKNYWDVEKGKNLTFSIILKSINLPIHKGYLINLFICNAIHKTLMTYYHNNNYCNYYNKYNNIFWIKWPNDIILMNKKIGGILIENSVFYKKIHTSIIGIGLNVNQIQFNKKLKASSLKKFFHKDFDLKKLFYNIIDSIQKEYFLLFKNSSPNNNIRIYGEKIIRNYYIDYLYLKDRISIFSVKNTINHGLIRNITEQGHLIIELIKNKKLYIFSQKEIQFF
ncbi:biotin--[acetyl-CoA-carboxylase] ligase [Blattabacterium cuenoti]|uniref:biotin--[acetyl-CoA-carboxylase] ligase n=1 Tax=Blattabacterium cuenoti TaxID=1653831 RepID=UPI00163CDE59|nr:biotin--[acetyl-CoA-carboxylase] ligase [Blattabacterium cuenoti]